MEALEMREAAFELRADLVNRIGEMRGALLFQHGLHRTMRKTGMTGEITAREGRWAEEFVRGPADLVCFLMTVECRAAMRILKQFRNTLSWVN